VEQPVRRHPLKWWWETLLALLAVVGLWIGIDSLHYGLRGRLFIGTDPNPVPISERVHALNTLIPGTGISIACSIGISMEYDYSTRPNYKVCLKPGEPGAGEIFMFGDSHAMHLLPMLDDVTNRTGQSITFSFMMACLADPSIVVSYRDYGPCQDFMIGEMARSVNRLKSGDVMVISNWLNFYLSDIKANGKPNDVVLLKDGKRLTPAQARSVYIRNLRDYAMKLNSKGVRLVLVVDNPVLALEPRYCADPSDVSTTCYPDSSVTLQMQDTLRKTLYAAAKDMPNVFVFDPTPYFTRNGRVRYQAEDGQYLFTDDHHLSISGSLVLATPFYDFLKRNNLANPTR